MDVKYINPFVSASKRVLHQVMEIEPNIETPKLLNTKIAGDDIVVIVGLTGEISGQVFFTMSETTALKIARKLTFNPELTELDVVSKSAISEIGNMISGATGMEMYSNGVEINITPPTLCRGSGMVISSENKFVSIPIDINEFGKIHLNISFDDKE